MKDFDLKTFLVGASTGAMVPVWLWVVGITFTDTQLYILCAVSGTWAIIMREIKQ